MKEQYYLNDAKTKLIMVKNDDVFSYNFIQKKWVENDFWYNEIFFEGAVNCVKITEKKANEIMRGNGYEIN